MALDISRMCMVCNIGTLKEISKAKKWMRIVGHIGIEHILYDIFKSIDSRKYS